MNKEIFLTTNRYGNPWAAFTYQIDRLKLAITGAGYTYRMITPTDMYEEMTPGLDISKLLIEFLLKQ